MHDEKSDVYRLPPPPPPVQRNVVKAKLIDKEMCVLRGQRNPYAYNIRTMRPTIYTHKRKLYILHYIAAVSI